jgi:hypothetical protein
LLTKGTAETAFQVNLERLIPGVFYKYHDIDSITVIGTCTFKDKKGHESHGNAMRAKFTRDNSESINWGNISLSDLPAIADDYWVHP